MTAATRHCCCSCLCLICFESTSFQILVGMKYKDVSVNNDDEIVGMLIALLFGGQLSLPSGILRTISIGRSTALFFVLLLLLTAVSCVVVAAVIAACAFRRKPVQSTMIERLYLVFSSEPYFPTVHCGCVHTQQLEMCLFRFGGISDTAKCVFIDRRYLAGVDILRGRASRY